MRQSDRIAAAQLRNAAWRIAEALVGSSRRAVLGRALEVQDYLYFCWNTTRVKRLVLRAVNALLSLSLLQEVRVLRQQLRVLRLACMEDIQIAALLRAMHIEYGARMEKYVGRDWNPAAVNLLQRAADENLPMGAIRKLLSSHRLVIDDRGEVDQPEMTQRRRALWIAVAVSAIWMMAFGLITFRDGPGEHLNLPAFLLMASLVVAYFARGALSTLRREQKLVDRLRDVKPAKGLKSAGCP